MNEPKEKRRSFYQRRQRSSRVKGKYGVVIPALNEAETIGSVVKGIRRLGLSAIVVDDGSKDATASLASEEGAIVISHVQTRGKGSSIRAGIEYVLRKDFDAVITCDADGQHEPRDIMRLIYEAERQHAAIVLGNRMENPETMPRVHRITNRLMSNIISGITRFKVPDSQCGMRLIRKEVLQGIRLRSKHFEIESELLLASAKRRWKVISVPIKTIYNGEKSKRRPFRDTCRFMNLVFKYVFLCR